MAAAARRLPPALLLSACLLPAGCATTGGSPPPDRVSWEEAVEIISSGEVETVFQTHRLLVTLYMRDGRVFETREPRIDLIIDVIEECGAPCAGTLVATE